MLFATRRSYNASKKAFTNNAAQVTRYVWVKDGSLDPGGTWKGGAIKQKDWFDRVEVKASSDDVLIYIHGFNTRQIDNVRRLERIEAELKAQGYKGSVVAFEWPSNGNRLAYDPDLADVRKTSQYLVSDLIMPLLSGSWRPRVHLLAHSMGGYAVICGFRDFGDSHGPGAGAWKVDQVAFVSADVHQPSMEKGAWGALVMKHHSERFTNYYSEKDRVLKTSKFINGTRDRIGLNGLSSPTFSAHVDVNCTDQYVRDDVNNQDSLAFSHGWWFENKAFYEDLAQTLAGVSSSNTGTRVKLAGGDFKLHL